jgi:hypothetical protein
MLRRAALASLLATAACSPSGEPDADCRGGKCDDLTEDPTTFACQGVPDAAGKHDPIAELLIKKGDSCPSNFKEVMAKLDAVDGEGCANAQGGVRTALVSDRARLLGAPEAYRTVTTRTCGGRPDHAIFFTLLGVQPDSKGEDFTFLEMMAFDPASRQFNFYTQTSGAWDFVGTSADAIDGTIGCGSCHNAGGPIMKELDRPWVHWDADDPLPGADQVFASMPELGQRTSAAFFEQVMKQGHRAMNATRIELLARPDSGAPARLLRPLFCQLEINLDTAAETLGGPVERIPVDFFLDPGLVEEGSVPVDPAAYAAAVARAGQRVPGVSGATDTEFAFIFPERAHIDTAYVQQLGDAGLVDEELVRDVLAVDFTRALYSDARCDLLKYAPRFASAGGGEPDAGSGPEVGDCCTAKDTAGCSVPSISECVCAADSFCCSSSFDATCAAIAASQCDAACPAGPGGGDPTGPQAPTNTATIAAVTPEALRAGFIENLRAASPAPGSAEAALLANLETTGDAEAHAARARAFLAACAARPAAELLDDVLLFADAIRNRTRGQAIIEHPSQLTETTLQAGFDVRLDPATCRAVSGR